MKRSLRCDSPLRPSGEKVPEGRLRGEPVRLSHLRQGLVLGLLLMLIVIVDARPIRADVDEGATDPASVAIANTSSLASPPPAASNLRERASRGRNRSPSGLWSSDGVKPVTVAIALVLAIVGGLATVARRFMPRPSTSTVQVVGRTNLSPKHSVYLLQVGRRVLLVGTGPQGAPSLISELDEIPESRPDARREDGS
jgi:Flagellar biosynthesis protein, FliO